MQVNIRKLGAGTGERAIAFSTQLDLSHLTVFGQHPFSAPVSVEGEVRERSGILTLSYTAQYILQLPCARCLTPVSQEGKAAFSHTLAEEIQDEENDTLVLVPDGILHLDELVGADLCLHVDTVALCSADCKGLCPRCGVNKNQQECTCSQV